MRSCKQHKYLPVLLAIGLCYLPCLLVTLAILTWPLAWLTTTLEFHPDPWAVAVLYSVIIDDLLVITWNTVLAIRTLNGALSPARFCLLATLPFLIFIALSYALIVVTNLTFEMGWAVM